MTDSSRDIDAPDDLAVENRIDELSDLFEDDLKSGGNPRIEDFLAQVPPSLHERLLAELIAIEMECRKRLGESPVLDDYASRFGEFHSVLTSAFSDAAVETDCSVSRDGPAEGAEVTSRLGPGSLIGEYKLLAEIGIGGMGRVFKATHQTMNRTVALKFISVKTGMSHAAAARFQREVEVAAQLTHENIVRAYDARRHEDALFLVMEYVEGRDLAACVGMHGPLAPELAIDCVLQAARGLQYAHERDVIHRDVKPSNLIRSELGPLRILDLGLAHAGWGQDTDRELTSAGATLGTIDFMSPEQARDPHAADARSDVYSLGCTLFYLITGRVPYEGNSAVARIIAHRESPIPDMRAVAPHSVPADLQGLFARMVAKDPADRPSSMNEVIAALQAILSPPGPVLDQGPPGNRSHSPSGLAAQVPAHPHGGMSVAAECPSRRRPFVLLSGVLAALTVVGYLLITLRSGWSPAPDGPGTVSVMVSAPAPGQKVRMQEELQGCLSGKGWPVVYVRPEGLQYFPQPVISALRADGGFTAQLHVGIDSTPDGMRFKVFVVVARDQQHAQELIQKGALFALPDDCSVSRGLMVYRQNPAVPPTPPRRIAFAGRDWIVKEGKKLDPGPNNWSLHPRSLWLDEAGHLHLAIQKTEDGWSCAEVSLDAALGRGEYRWVISVPANSFLALDPQATVGFVLFEDAANEIDVELAAWGNPERKGQFAVQPCARDSMHQFALPKSPCFTCSVLWTAQAVESRLWTGEDLTRPPVAKWRYTGPKLPALEDLRTRMTFFLHEGKPPGSAAPQEVVVRAFHFTPGGGAATPPERPN